MKVKGHYPLNNVQFNFDSSRNKIHIQTCVPSVPSIVTLNTRQQLGMLTNSNCTPTHNQNATQPQTNVDNTYRRKYSKPQKLPSKICVQDLLTSYASSDYRANETAPIQTANPSSEIKTTGDAITDLISFLHKYKNEKHYSATMKIAAEIQRAYKIK